MNEELIKSIDALLDEVFAESEDVEQVEKSLDIAQDSKTTADEAIASAPKAQKDESRNAGRPKQISDIPQTDKDGRRESEYDASITENKNKEDEPEETKKQVKVLDQVTPMRKSESEMTISKEEFEAFQAFKKSMQEKEELVKAEKVKEEQTSLIKAAISDATSKLFQENQALKKSLEETQILVKAMAGRPQSSKAITDLEVLEKSSDPASKAKDTFSKSEILDAAFELAKSGKISSDVVSEIEMTNYCSDIRARKTIEQYLEGK